jgi:hypothetical protein
MAVGKSIRKFFERIVIDNECRGNAHAVPRESLNDAIPACVRFCAERRRDDDGGRSMRVLYSVNHFFDVAVPDHLWPSVYRRGTVSGFDGFEEGSHHTRGRHAFDGLGLVDTIETGFNQEGLVMCASLWQRRGE